MKKIIAVIVIVLMSLTLAACGKVNFEVTENTGKRMTITAEKAEKDSFFMVGSLEAEEGDRIVITSRLTKGQIRVEIVGASDQGIDTLPDVNAAAIITANLQNSDGAFGTVPAGYYLVRATCLEKATGTVQIEVEPTENNSGNGGEADGVDYGRIKSDLSGLTPDMAKAYLAVTDELADHLGYEEAEGSEGECLHGGFIRDWDGDGIPELCLLLRTSPRDTGEWDGTPVYGWYPPTLYLYTFQNGQAVRVEESHLYFTTAGREAVVAVLPVGDGLQYICWDRTAVVNETVVCSYALKNGTAEKTETPAIVADASQGAETAQEFLDALGTDAVQPLLYNSSGETRIEGEANARELRAELASAAS